MFNHVITTGLGVKVNEMEWILLQGECSIMNYRYNVAAINENKKTTNRFCLDFLKSILKDIMLKWLDIDTRVSKSACDCVALDFHNHQK